MRKSAQCFDYAKCASAQKTKEKMSNFGPSSIQHNLSMSSNADVIVIGGGVSGLVAASEVKHYDPGIEVELPTVQTC